MRRFALPGIVAVLALALVGLLVFGVMKTSDDTSIDQAVAAGNFPTAHDASLPLLDGGHTTLAAYRGKVVVVNFFAHWCDPCKDEAPLLRAEQQKLAGHDATLLGVAWNDDSDHTRAFVRDYKVDYPVARDVDGSFASAYGVKGMPETFVIDPRGRIVALRRGELTAQWIKENIDPVVDGRTTAAAPAHTS